MVICPIARAVHCTGCFLVKFCPAKTFLGDYGKEGHKACEKPSEDETKSSDDSSADSSTAQT